MRIKHRSEFNERDFLIDALVNINIKLKSQRLEDQIQSVLAHTAYGHMRDMAFFLYKYAAIMNQDAGKRLSKLLTAALYSATCILTVVATALYLISHDTLNMLIVFIAVIVTVIQAFMATIYIKEYKAMLTLPMSYLNQARISNEHIQKQIVHRPFGGTKSGQIFNAITFAELLETGDERIAELVCKSIRWASIGEYLDGYRDMTYAEKMDWINNRLPHTLRAIANNEEPAYMTGDIVERYIIFSKKENRLRESAI